MHHLAQACSVAAPLSPVVQSHRGYMWSAISQSSYCLGQDYEDDDFPPDLLTQLMNSETSAACSRGGGVNFCVPVLLNELVPPGLQARSPSLLHSPRSSRCSHRLANDWVIGQKSFLAQNSPATVNLPTLRAYKRQVPRGTATQSLFIEVPQTGQGCGPCTKAAN